MGESIT